MKHLNRRIAVWSAASLVILICLATGAAGQSDKSNRKWPPQFPREGATLLFENEHVVVWEQVGRPKDAFMHKHIRDILNIGIEPGGGIGVLNPDGPTGGGGSFTKTIYNKAPNNMTYTKAGLGPHAEVMKDSNNPGRSIFIEIKGTEPKDCREWSTACP